MFGSATVGGDAALSRKKEEGKKEKTWLLRLLNV
jgi:hypothetical protein